MPLYIVLKPPTQINACVRITVWNSEQILTDAYHILIQGVSKVTMYLIIILAAMCFEMRVDTTLFNDKTFIT